VLKKTKNKSTQAKACATDLLPGLIVQLERTGILPAVVGKNSLPNFCD
jgi:hypothetical protein